MRRQYGNLGAMLHLMQRTLSELLIDALAIPRATCLKGFCDAFVSVVFLYVLSGGDVVLKTAFVTMVRLVFFCAKSLALGAEMDGSMTVTFRIACQLVEQLIAEQKRMRI